MLQRAVERGVGSGPAGVYLSGGLDSASVAAAAADVSRSRGLPAPLALLVLLRGTQADEETTQRIVAQALGLHQLARTPASCSAKPGCSTPRWSLPSTTSGGPPQLVEPVYDALSLLARTMGARPS